MEHITIDYAPHAYQLDFHKDTSRWRIVAGGRRVGKTKMCIQEALRWALSTPDQNIYWVAPNHKTAKEVGWEELLSHIDDLQGAVERIWYSHLMVQFINGSRISFKSGDNPDALRGRKIHLIILDEAAFIKPDIWMVVRPALADSGGHAILISTPNGIGDWFHAIYCSEAWSTYHWESMLNPLMNEKEIADIRSQISQSEFDQEILAKFVTRAGRVYNDFNDANVIPSFVPDRTKHDFYLGMDFGFASPTSIAFIAVDRATGDKVVQFDEIYVDRTQIDDIVNLLRIRLSEWKIKIDDIQYCYCDPAGEAEELSSGKSPVDSLRSAGFSVINKATRINPGLALVRAFIKTSLGKRRFFVTKRCKETYRSLTGYQYISTREGRIKEEALKDGLHDHLCDAIRYFFVNRFDHAKYVAKTLKQTKYGVDQTIRIVMKKCSECRRPFSSRTPKHEPPFVCNQCKED